MSSISISNRELALRIREGNQRRMEEQRRLQALRQAYDESRQEELRTKSGNGPHAYLPIILVFLLFVSFPLSEPLVDWYLVAFFCALNLLYAILVREPSHWMNVLTVILANLVLVRLSPYLYDVPALLLSLPPLATALYVAGNAVLALVLYCGYVQQRFVFKPDARRDVPLSKDVGTPSSSSSNLSIAGGSGRRDGSHTDTVVLEAFLRETEREWRKDVAGSVLLLANVAVLAYSGILPREVIAQTARNVFRLIS